MGRVIQNNFRVRKHYGRIKKIIDIPNLIEYAFVRDPTVPDSSSIFKLLGNYFWEGSSDLSATRIDDSIVVGSRQFSF